MTVLSFNKKKYIYPLLTIAFEKKTFAGSERIGLIDLNSRNQQSLQMLVADSRLLWSGLEAVH